MSPQLTRSATDRVIAGVAGGVAQRFGVSSTLVRLGWVVSVFLGGFGVLAYLILWVALPKGTPQIPAGGDSGEWPVRVLEERYARGEITREEFLERRAVLGGSTTGATDEEER